MNDSAERVVDPGSSAIRTNPEREIVDIWRIQNEALSFREVKHLLHSGCSSSSQLMPTCSRTALKPADDNARLTTTFNAECYGKRPALRQHETGCRP